MTPLHAVILAATGLVAGFLNVVAGGGSLLTVPALIFTGLPATVANGTNRIALVAQNAVAVLNFRRKGFHDLGLGLRLSVPAILGAVVGAQIAVSISDQLFRYILSGVMVLVMVVIVVRRGGGARPGPPQQERLPNLPLQYGLFFVVGVYGGFIQAGVGYLILFSLSAVGGLSLVRTNSIKVIVVGAYMIPSLVVFIVGGKVEWLPGLALTVGNAAGGWLGSAFSVSKGDRWIKLVLLLVVIGITGRLVGLY